MIYRWLVLFFFWPGIAFGWMTPGMTGVVDAGGGVLTIRPNTGGSTNWDCWNACAGALHDEQLSDQSDTSYVYTATLGEYERLGLADHTTETGTITNVRVYWRIKGDSGTTLRRYVYISTTTYASDVTLTTSYVDSYNDWAVNPEDSQAWEWTDIDALTVGARSDPAGLSDNQYWSEAWVEVTYE